MSCAATRGRGFTLLEVLVVAFIIAIIAGFAILSIDTRAGADRLQQEATRLRALMQIASEDAVLFGAEIGLDLTDNGYRFVRLEADGWTPIANPTNPLRPRALPGDLQLRLLTTDTDPFTDQRPAPGLPMPEKGEQDPAESGKHLQPEILFLSSGAVTPFKLELSSLNTALRYLYSNRDDGKLTMQQELPAGA
ncbi:MAG: type II secretion system minor pseudopilin GspH [Salinisphaera sp.]|nr:type II secretion system minor pseudopilin GspH [Salinisphaera sp.]